MEYKDKFEITGRCNITIYNMDCNEFLEQCQPNEYNLAICDPPYGDGGQELKGAIVGRFGGRFDKYKLGENDKPATRTGGTWAAKYGTEIKHWDVAPEPEYFEKLSEVSEYQIIWGGNYFALPPSRNFIIWQKLTISESFSMAMAEYAWTNINGNSKIFAYAPQGKKHDPRFHPTSKPISLYSWLLNKYAKPGDKILDTHLGSGSIAIACWDLGFDLVACELDCDYYKKACERLTNHTKQGQLF